MQSLDKQIIALHQALVNVTGKRPQWWAEQVSWLSIVSAWVYAAIQGINPWTVIVVALYSITGAAFICTCRIEPIWAVMKKVSQSHVFTRMLGWVIFLLMSTIVALLLAVNGPVAAIVALAVCNLATLSYDYFTLCEDPPPPKPRARTSLAGGH